MIGELNVEKNKGPCEKMSVKVVTETQNFMKTRKAARPSGVTPDLLKVCKDVGRDG